jgi:hypothetical protein
VPVTNTDDDDSYTVQPTALVRNDTYHDGILGTVVLRAQNTGEPCGFSLGGVGVACDSNRHQLVATVLLRNGDTVDCAEPHSHSWSGDGYQDITLTCDEQLPLSEVKSVRVDREA